MTPDAWPIATSQVPNTSSEPPADAHPSPVVAHEVSVRDGRFALAMCTCGWHGAGRRLRASARAEAHDHALLYADGRTLSTGAPSPQA